MYTYFNMFSSRMNSPRMEKSHTSPRVFQRTFFKPILCKTVRKSNSAIVTPSKSGWSFTNLLRMFTPVIMKKWIPPLISEGDEYYWVIRVGRNWPKPEVYGSILLPCKETRIMERYVMAFKHKEHAISASKSYPFKNHRIFINQVSREYLETATLNSISVAVFDDMTYLQPSLIIPKIHADDHSEHSSKITHNLNICLQLPFQK